MSNTTWVCFDCQLAVRRDLSAPDAVCARCGCVCVNLGHRIPTPRKGDDKTWERLRKSLQDQAIDKAYDQYRANIRRRHDIEKQIAKLEALPECEGRRRQIRYLRKRLKPKA
ncbi:MAG: hypothetical protein H6819_10265 [Phycisphaerales bacterium]|nr:hypothetical protein [Phycisphaerales bacterium]MCB9856599.1 hypothetical protein [Phycisphaerales bacterium]MCB9864604.1 hypothetical protein [Phycisphaerales bacterium]